VIFVFGPACVIATALGLDDRLPCETFVGHDFRKTACDRTHSLCH
jgi:hypothetical protein